MKRPLWPRFWNKTTPDTLAKRVSSLPRPTFLPGRNLVPRWRTRIEPPLTVSPPNAFTPSRWELLSRPFRELPWPFLCAISPSTFDCFDAERGVRLAMPFRASVALALLLLEHQHLGSAILGRHRRRHRDPVDVGPAEGNLPVTAHEHHPVETYFLSHFGSKPLDVERLSGHGLLLFSTGFEDRVQRETSYGKTTDPDTLAG